MNEKCAHSTCSKNAVSRGYCKKHYTRIYRTGKFDKLIEQTINRKCSVDKCSNKYYGKGYCSKHYQKNKKHGSPYCEKRECHKMSKTSEYATWSNMKERCYNKNGKSYVYYGGRGIIVCESWKNSFVSFLSDMGQKPNLKMEIDRINNDGNYEPDNCRWVMPYINARNRRTVKLTQEKADIIRAMKAKGVRTATLADDYSVSTTTIKDIVNNKIWRKHGRYE